MLARATIVVALVAGLVSLAPAAAGHEAETVRKVDSTVHDAPDDVGKAIDERRKDACSDQGPRCEAWTAAEDAYGAARETPTQAVETVDRVGHAVSEKEEPVDRRIEESRDEACPPGSDVGDDTTCFVWRAVDNTYQVDWLLEGTGEIVDHWAHIAHELRHVPGHAICHARDQADGLASARIPRCS